jgi:hypothetical protein
MEYFSQAVTSAISQVRRDTVTDAFSKLVSFLDERIELTDELKAMFEDFRATYVASIPADAGASFVAPAAVAAGKKKPGRKAKSDATTKSDAPKTLRAIRMNNLFIQDKMAELKAAGAKADPEKGNLLKQATTMWRELTPEAKAAYEEANCDRLAEINRQRLENPEEYLASKATKAPKTKVSEVSEASEATTTKPAKAAKAPKKAAKATKPKTPSPVPVPVEEPAAEEEPVEADPEEEYVDETNFPEEDADEEPEEEPEEEVEEDAEEDDYY